MRGLTVNQRRELIAAEVAGYIVSALGKQEVIGADAQLPFSFAYRTQT